MTIPATCMDVPAELPAAHRESTALGVREPKRSRTKLFAEDAILFSEIGNYIFLVAIHPAATVSTRNCSAWGIAKGYSAEMPGTERPSTIHLASAVFRTLRDQGEVAERPQRRLLHDIFGIVFIRHQRLCQSIRGIEMRKNDRVSPLAGPVCRRRSRKELTHRALRGPAATSRGGATRLR